MHTCLSFYELGS